MHRDTRLPSEHSLPHNLVDSARPAAQSRLGGSRSCASWLQTWHRIASSPRPFATRFSLPDENPCATRSTEPGAWQSALLSNSLRARPHRPAHDARRRGVCAEDRRAQALTKTSSRALSRSRVHGRLAPLDVIGESRLQRLLDLLTGIILCSAQSAPRDETRLHT